jgi:hypothetical protein
MKTKAKMVKCPWCMKMVRIHKGRLNSHLVNAKQKCVGVGQPITLPIITRTNEK